MTTPTPNCAGRSAPYDAMLDHAEGTPAWTAARTEAATICGGCSVSPCWYRVHGCGTDAGYNRHRRRREDACGPCKTAHAAASRLRARVRGYAA